MWHLLLLNPIIYFFGFGAEENILAFEQFNKTEAHYFIIKSQYQTTNYLIKYFDHIKLTKICLIF